MRGKPLTPADQARIYQTLLAIDPGLADRTAAELATDRDPVARAVARLEVTVSRELAQVRWLVGLAMLLMAALVGVDIVLRFSTDAVPDRGSSYHRGPGRTLLR
jgi:hypothetical protein